MHLSVYKILNFAVFFLDISYLHRMESPFEGFFWKDFTSSQKDAKKSFERGKR